MVTQHALEYCILSWGLSCLPWCQIRGRKRMVFWSRAALDSLYLYPNWHILRRRSRCNPVQPDFRKFPKFEGLSGIEVRPCRSSYLCVAFVHILFK